MFQYLQQPHARARSDAAMTKRCVQCHGVKSENDLILIEENPVCRVGPCKERYYESTHPRPVPRSLGYYDKG